MSALSTDLFDYPLPEHLIAQAPAPRRDASRLMVVHRVSRQVEHRRFGDLPEYLRSGDCLVRNNAAVLPARLTAQRPTGGAVECFLLRPATTAAHHWWCLLRPGKKLPAGATFGVAGVFEATVITKGADGVCEVAFTMADGNDVVNLANRCGEMPLPPYIARRSATPEQRAADLQRYQTVYAAREKQVAIAAPTAGLHFTPELLSSLTEQGVQLRDVLLHVGLGTFRPISTDTVDAHQIHHELYEMPASTWTALKAPTGRRIAVGTTSLRTIEDSWRRRPALFPADETFTAAADIFIYPPATFAGVDALITNFHQPRSTLICLLAAFLTPGSTEGIRWFKELYAEAVAQEYRFFSYGDAMLIL